MELIVMLYDEAIKSLSTALNSFDMEGPERIERINNNVILAQNIITELAVSLDMEKGGEVASNLHRIYDFMLDHLTQANVTKDRQPITEVSTLMQDLRESWQKILEEEPLGAGSTSSSRMGTVTMVG
jgi:flagellar secretion chaperone FliS